MESRNTLSPQRQSWLATQHRRHRQIVAARCGILFGFLLLWEMAARFAWIDPFITSSPSRVAATLVRMSVAGELWRHVAITTAEAVAGFLIGTALGTLVAVVLWYSSFLTRVLEPYLVILNALPKIALGPIFIVWLGAGPISILAITLSISIVVSILEVLGGFVSTDPEMVRLVQTFGGTRRQILRYVVFPANLPTIVSSLKINVGMSWVGVIVGEFLISKAGLGYLIVYGSQVFALDLVMTSVLVLSVVATLMYFCIQWVERLLLRQRSEANYQ